MIADLEDFNVVNARYPHIGNRLRAAWGQEGFAALVRDLTGAAGGQGFPTDIKLCLGNLLAHHEAEFNPHDDDAPPAAKLLDPAQNEHIRAIVDRFPRVGKQLIDKWGTAEFPPYINDLINDTRDGKRAGFPADVATALFRLMMQHDREFPEFEVQPDDIWAQHEDGTQGRNG